MNLCELKEGVEYISRSNGSKYKLFNGVLKYYDYIRWVESTVLIGDLIKMDFKEYIKPIEYVGIKKALQHMSNCGTAIHYNTRYRIKGGILELEKPNNWEATGIFGYMLDGDEWMLEIK